MNKLQKLKAQALWIAGFIDREASFRVSIRYNKYLKGYQVFPEFSISQGRKNIGNLYLLKAFFRCGVVRHHYNYGGLYRSNKKYMVYSVINVKNLLERILPFCENNPVKSKILRRYQIFKRILLKMQKGDHLTKKGIQEIIKINYRIPFVEDENG